MLELYIKDGCPHCQKQIEQLELEGLAYQLHNISNDRAALQAAKKKHGANMVPVLVENGKVKSIGYKGMG